MKKKQRSALLKKTETGRSDYDILPELKLPLPTTFELTQIAALLSDKLLLADNSELAKKAFQLWEACDRALDHEKISRAINGGNWKVMSMGIRGVRGEAPKSWPCSFDEALRLVMPEKRTKGDRYSLFRLFLRDVVQTEHFNRHSGEPSSTNSSALSENEMLDKIETAFTLLKQGGFSNIEEYEGCLKSFSYWLSDHEGRKTSEQRSLAAKARWGRIRGGGEKHQIG